VVERGYENTRIGNDEKYAPDNAGFQTNVTYGRGHGICKTTGWQPTCSCDADIDRCLVLDPFAGSGTVGVVAWKLGRDFVGFDLSPDYCEMANRRIQESMGKKNGQLLLAEATA